MAKLIQEKKGYCSICRKKSKQGVCDQCSEVTRVYAMSALFDYLTSGKAKKVCPRCNQEIPQRHPSWDKGEWG